MVALMSALKGNQCESRSHQSPLLAGPTWPNGFLVESSSAEGGTSCSTNVVLRVFQVICGRGRRCLLIRALAEFPILFKGLLL